MATGQDLGLYKMPVKTDGKPSLCNWQDTVSCKVGPVGILFLKLLLLPAVSFSSLPISP